MCAVDSIGKICYNGSVLKRRIAMDTVKIGKYIAGKRKALGMTQAQVAEKLGMSDKSVSKWERGICLPDVYKR